MADKLPETTRTQLHLRGGNPYLSVTIDEDAILAMARRIVKKRFKRLSKPLELDSPPGAIIAPGDVALHV